MKETSTGMKEECIVNVATGRYVKGQKRLLENLKNVGFVGDVISWTDELPPGSPTHEDSPMGFKPFAMKYAFERGFRRVLWLDVNYMAVRSLVPIFRKIRKDGYYLYSVGNCFGEWCSDMALECFGIDRERALRILEINSSCLGISADNIEALKFLEEWTELAADGSTFRGIPPEYFLSRTNDNRDGQVSLDPRVKGHRHDQTAATFLAWRHRFHYSGAEIKNFRSVSPEGKNRYARAIPFTAALLHNRDISEWDMDYLQETDWLGNTLGPARIRYFALSVVDTMRTLWSTAALRRAMRRENYYQ